MKKNLIIVVFLLFFSVFTSAEEKINYDNFANEQKKSSFDDLKEVFLDISLLNLLNGLNLSIKQMEDLLSVAVEAKNLQGKFNSDYMQLAEDTKIRYKELRAELVEKGTDVQKEVQKSAVELEKKVKEVKDKFDAEMKSLEGKVDQVLFASQKDIVIDFKPCLVPPKSLKNPTRVGQAYDSGPIEQELKKIRKMNEKEYNEKIGLLLDKMVAQEEERFLGQLSDDERKKEKERLMSVINKAKVMDDAEFELNKEDLAKEMDLKYEKDMTERKLEKFNRNKKILGKTGRLLLDARIIPILEKKIKIAKGFEKQQGNLDEVKPAEGAHCGMDANETKKKNK